MLSAFCKHFLCDAAHFSEVGPKCIGYGGEVSRAKPLVYYNIATGLQVCSLIATLLFLPITHYSPSLSRPCASTVMSRPACRFVEPAPDRWLCCLLVP